MPEAFTVGGLLLPTRPVAVILSLMLAIWTAKRFAARLGVDAHWAGGVAERMAWLGILGARVGYVALNWSAFRAQPWTALYVWQPGYLFYTGIMLSIAYALLQLARRPSRARWPSLKVLAAGYASGAIVLGGVFVALYALAPSNALRPGDRIPDFIMLDLAGNTVRFSDLNGRGVVINFWATWCSPCRREVPLLDEIQTEYSTRGLTVIGINLDESADTVASFINEMKVRYPIWLNAEPARAGHDRVRDVYERFGGVGLPTTVFADRQGIVRATHVGELNRAILQERAEEILSQ